MTREEAIKAIKSHCYFANLVPVGKEALDMAIKALSQEPCEDAISRQAALDIYDDYNVAVENGELEAYRKHRKRLLKLPSVQPKPIECEDAISRKEALEALEQEEPLVWCDGADEIAAHSQWSSDVDTIKNMPSVQPKYNTSEWCHDCKEYDQDKHCCPRFNNVIRNAVEKIKESKTGHWILTDDDFVYCSECEDSYYPRPIDASWYYCPHCGAKMIEPQAESEGTDAGSN